MNITKYEHSCFSVEKDGNCIVVDPGTFTTDFSPSSSIVAVVITHIHGDHFDLEQLEAIEAKNPGVVFIGPADVTKQLTQFDTRTVRGGDSFALSGFDLDFYGDEHAIIYPSLPSTQNVGVLIEDRIYYPGDSFTIPEKSVDTLALPVSAPWLKISESIDFMKAVGARFAFPTHDAILSLTGQNVVDRMIAQFSDEVHTIYQRIDGQSIEIE